MSLIAFILYLVISGLVVGALARLIVPGRQPIGILATILLGIAGSFVGGLIFWAVADKPGKHPLLGFILAVISAAALIWLLVGSTTRGGLFRRRRIL